MRSQTLASAIFAIFALPLAVSVARPQAVLRGLPSTDGTVYALSVIGNTLYVGGSFTQLGLYTGAGAMTDATSGATAVARPSFVSTDFGPGGLVFAVCEDGSGGWFAGGIFSNVGGQARQNLVHVLADGSVDAWNPGASAPVRALLRSGSTLYVGGDFATLGGQARSHLGALDTGSGAALGWNPGADDIVTALTLNGSTLYVGGQFQHLAGQSRVSIGAVDASTGVASAWAPALSPFDIVYSIAVDATRAYFGGLFANVNGQARANAAAVDRTTGANTPWTPNPNGAVHAIVLSGTSLFAAGEFTSIGGQPRPWIAKLDNTNGSADVAWNAAADDYIYDLKLDGTSLLVGGAFTTIGGQPRAKAASIALTNGSANPFHPVVNGSVWSLARSGGRVFLGGSFNLGDFSNRANLAAIDLTTLHVTSWDPQIGGLINGPVRALATDGTTLYAGGIFTLASGVARRSLASFSVATGELQVFDAHLNQASAMIPDVLCLSLEPGTLRVGGQLVNVAGTARSYAAAVDPATGSLQAWAPEPNNPVRAFARVPAGVFIAGSFTTAGGQPRTLLAQVDASTGSATSWLPPAFSGMFRPNGTYQDPTLLTLGVDGSHLYVGGSFSAAGGVSRANATSLDVASGAVEGWTPPGSMVVGGGPYGAYAFETASQPVFVGEINPFVNGLLSLDPATGAADAWPPVVGSVRALARWGGSLVLGGDFQSIGGDHQLNGSQHVGGLAIVSDPTAAGVGDRPAGGTHLAMSLPQPQPARAGVVVILSLSRATSVSVHVLDTMGRLERTVLADAPLTAGRQPLSVDVSGLAPGLHWLHVSANGEQAGRKIVVAR